ncbi:MAG TPA: sugar phosphate isomerase/epimerase family protein [Caulifigura sp.]|nr:sugar phosphate isomerase/epimerase family protein [Caulifigura sp.]
MEASYLPEPEEAAGTESELFEPASRSQFERVRLPRQVQNRLSVNQMTTPRWCLEEDLENYADAGLTAIGLNWQKFDDDALSADVERIRQSGLAVSSLGWCGGFTGAGGLTFPDAMFDARRKLRIARQIRAGALVVIPGVQFTHIRSHAVRLAMQAVAELCEAAADSTVKIALQPMDALFGKNWSFLNRLEETLEILERVNCPSAQFCFGTYHLWQEPRLLELLPRIVNRIAVVQLSDWREPPRSENDRALPGDGVIPLPEIVTTLEQAGYRGLYEVEVWSRDLWKLEHQQLLGACFQRSGTLLADSFAAAATIADRVDDGR